MHQVVAGDPKHYVWSLYDEGSKRELPTVDSLALHALNHETTEVEAVFDPAEPEVRVHSPEGRMVWHEVRSERLDLQGIARLNAVVNLANRAGKLRVTL